MQRPNVPFFAAVLLFLLIGMPRSVVAAVLPEGLVEETVGSGWEGVAGVVAGPNADGTKTRVYGWEAGGKVWIVEDGVRLAQPLVDISAEVGAELSLLGFALDPAFQTTGHIYLLYTVDRNVLLGKPGRAPTIGRVTRYTCRRDNGFTSVDPASRKILIGETKSTGIPLLERSHTVGALVFGEDGSLLVSTGDGAGGSETEIDIGNSPNALQAIEDGIIPASLNIGAWRSQSPDAMSGKILRINPETGDGIAGNPFYQTTDPRSSRSRVWAYGLRNPFRFAVQPGTGKPSLSDPRPGTIVLGDAGWNTADSLFVAASGGINMGWPAFEGFDATPGYREVTAPSFVNTTSRAFPTASWTPTGARADSHISPAIYRMGTPGNPIAGPDFTGRASIGGTFIESTTWPVDWANRYLHMDWGSDDAGGGGWVRAFTRLDSYGVSAIQPFGSDWYHVSHLSFHKPSNSLYYVVWPSTVKRVSLAPAASGPGLMSQRYETGDFSGPSVASVVADPNFIQPQIYVPGSSSEINPAYSIRYRGTITPRYSESYRLVVDVNDSAKIWINDQLVLDVGNPSGPSPDYWLQEGSAFSLSAGVPAKIKVEYVNRGANSRFTLFWKSASQALEPIPSYAYQTPAGDVSPPTFTVTGPETVQNTVFREGSDAPFSAIITPSRPVTALTLASLNLMGCRDSIYNGPIRLSFNPNGTYTFFASASGSAFSVAVKEGAATDAAGIPSLASNVYQGRLIYQAYFYGATPSGTTAGEFIVGLEVRGTSFLTSDLVLENCEYVSTRDVVNRDFTSYYVTLRPLVAGPMSVGLKAERFGIVSKVNVSYDPTLRPTVSLKLRGTSETLYTQGPFGVEVSASAPLNGLTASDFSIINGTALSLSPISTPASGPQLYSLNVQPTASGQVQVSLPADAATSVNGSGNLASQVVAATYSAPIATFGLTREIYTDTNLELLKNSQQIGNIAYSQAANTSFVNGIDIYRPNYSWRSTGSIIPRYSETYRFIMDFDDGVRLYVNDQLILDDWNTTGSHWQQKSAAITLQAGRAYNFRLDYRDLNSPGVQYLFWQSASQLFEIVPSSQFRPVMVQNPSKRPALTLTPRFINDSFPTPGAFCVEVETSGPLVGLTASDFVITNGTALSLSLLASPADGGQRYILSIRPTAPGLVQISLPADVATKSVGTGNQASAVATATYALPDPSYGLLQETFAGRNFETLLYSRQVPNVAYFDGGNGLFSDGNIPSFKENYSFRLTGSLVPRFSETYTFVMDFDDAVRLYVNDQLVLDSWETTGVQWQKPSATLSLIAGRAYNFRLDYQQQSGPALHYLFWQSASQPLAVVAPEQFRPAPAIPPADSVSPVVNLSGPEIAIPGIDRIFGSSAPFTVQISTNEPLVGLTAFDFVLKGCTYSRSIGQPPESTLYSYNGSLFLSLNATDNDFSVTLPAGACTDEAGNPNAASNVYSGKRKAQLTISANVSGGVITTAPGDFEITVRAVSSESAYPSMFNVSNGSIIQWTYGGSNRSDVWYRGIVRPLVPGQVTIAVKDEAYAFGSPVTLAYAPETVRQNGVTVAWFSDAALTQPAGTAVVPNVNFDWALGSPAAGVPENQFSARFTGCVVPPVSGAMKFYVRADDGARLWLNGLLQFDHLDADVGEWSADFEAVEGMPVMVKIEFREGWGGAGIQAAWSGPGLEKQIISSARWLVNETGLQFPLAVTAAEEAAAATSQIPADYANSLASLPAVGRSLSLQPAGAGVFMLSWTCLEADRPWLVAESSSDLSEWEPLPLTNLTASAGSIPGYTDLELKVIPGAGARYFRLRAVR